MLDTVFFVKLDAERGEPLRTLPVPAAHRHPFLHISSPHYLWEAELVIEHPLVALARGGGTVVCRVVISVAT